MVTKFGKELYRLKYSKPKRFYMIKEQIAKIVREAVTVGPLTPVRYGGGDKQTGAGGRKRKKADKKESKSVEQGSGQYAEKGRKMKKSEKKGAKKHLLKVCLALLDSLEVFW